MASKGQKFSKYTPEFKEKILKEYLNGVYGECSLSRKFIIPRETFKT